MSLRAAISFLTPLPVGGPPPDGTALTWFPLVGLVQGLLLGGVAASLDTVYEPVVLAALVLLLDLVLTGMLHLDGLVDAADGLLSHLPRERRLEVMAQPDIGAFGFGAGAAVLLLRYAALLLLFAGRPSVLFLGGLWAASRTAMALGAVLHPYARSEDGGLASAFLAGHPPALLLALGGLVPAALLVSESRGALGGWALLAAMATAALVLQLARRRIGGFTGDVLGAAGVLAETVGLLVVVGRW